jgi:hypothetical protein
MCHRTGMETLYMGGNVGWISWYDNRTAFDDGNTSTKRKCRFFFGLNNSGLPD